MTAPAPFEAGGFYDAAMGAGLQKVLVGMSVPCNPAGLADWKSTTNRWEDEWAEQADAAVPRPLNLDPGYVTQAKLVLATTAPLAVISIRAVPKVSAISRRPRATVKA